MSSPAPRCEKCGHIAHPERACLRVVRGSGAEGGPFCGCPPPSPAPRGQVCFGCDVAEGHHVHNLNGTVRAPSPEERLAGTGYSNAPAAPERMEDDYWRHVAANLENVLQDQTLAIEKHFKEQHGDVRLFVFSDPAKTKILEAAMAAKDAEIAALRVTYDAACARATSAGARADKAEAERDWERKNRLEALARAERLAALLLDMRQHQGAIQPYVKRIDAALAEEKHHGER